MEVPGKVDKTEFDENRKKEVNGDLWHNGTHHTGEAVTYVMFSAKINSCSSQ